MARGNQVDAFGAAGAEQAEARLIEVTLAQVDVGALVGPAVGSHQLGR